MSPTREDTFVRGISEALGGPVGEHAAAGARSVDRALTPARIVLVLAVLVFGLHWLQKLPCQDGQWQDFEQYTHFCYTDVIALYYAEELHLGAVPYFDHLVEYPVLTGFLMGAVGLPVSRLADLAPGLNEAQLFYNLTAVVLITFGLAAVAAVLALRRRRPWDAALLALAPAVVVTATVNWDLFAVGLTALFLYAWASNRPLIAGVLLGLASAAKFYPLFLVGPLFLLALRSGRWRSFGAAFGAAAVTYAAVNAPVFVWANDGWDRFWQLNTQRAIDWGTIWYIGYHLPLSTGTGGGLQPFLWLGSRIATLNLVSYAIFALGCAGIGYLALAAPRRPRLAQLSFLVVAVFLLTSKVWSQQFVLWLVPLAVLARPRWGAFLAWQAAEIGYFLAFYGELLGASGRPVFPEGVFILAASLRWFMVAVLAGYVVRDIWHPQRDVVRRSYGDDPDGGPFAGARDRVTLGPVRNRRARDRRLSNPAELLG